ncbi:MAG: hypothetical protein GY797_33445 [Deltaproteobacteria bacterium]|nr:hypothetical protein [Deltaproteobacteria bacterium]
MNQKSKIISMLFFVLVLSFTLNSHAIVYWQDTFTDTASTALAAHTPNIGSSYLDPNSRYIISGSNTLTRVLGEDYASNYDATVTEYIYEIDLYMNNAGAFDAGITFRWISATDYFRVQLHSASTGTVRLYEEAVERAADTSWTSGVDWFTIKIVNTLENIKVYIDDVLYIDYDTTNNNTSTKFGFFNWSGCTPQWDNLEIYDETTSSNGVFNFGLGHKDDRLIKIQSK